MKKIVASLIISTFLISSLATAIETKLSPEPGEKIHRALQSHNGDETEPLSGEKVFAPYLIKGNFPEQEPLYLTSIRFLGESEQGFARIHLDIQRDLIVGQGKTFRYRYFQILSRGQAPDFDLNGGEPNSRPSIVTKEVAYAAFVLENWLLHYDGRQTMRNYILAVVPASSLDLRGGLRADNPAINYGPLTSKIDDIARKTPWISHIVLSSIKLQLLNSNFEVLASYSQPRDPARAGPMKRLSRFLFGGRPQPECEIILKPLRSRSWL